MFEILFLASTGILIFSCIYFEFDFLEPSVILATLMTFSIFIASQFAEHWGYDVGIRSIVCISLALLAFTFGSIFARRNFFHSQIKKDPSSKSETRIDVAIWKIFLALILISILLAFNFKESYELSRELGNYSGISNMIPTNRWAIESGIASFSRWTYYRAMIAQTFAYVSIYIFIRNLADFRLKDLWLTLPMIFFIPFIILNTGRMWLICLVIYILIVAGILRRKSNFSTLKIFFISGICFYAMFLLLGLFTGKTLMGNRSIGEIFVHYAGLSIPALEVALNQIWYETTAIGEYTLLGVYRVASKFIELPEVPLFLPFVQFHGIDTNVFTAEARYVKDFGFIGMAAVMWILGVTYSSIYNFVLRSRNSLALMFYGYLASPLFLSSIDERFFLDFFGTTSIYMLILIFSWEKFLNGGIRWRAGFLKIFSRSSR
ncbi:MAG: oligosaccharide repeat unit polymerase [Selenomonadaceae bacterium]|nr:oligosaccharide repeat unit polymerase [Selenomonadaceae bacterium]